jgi:hypothetical protein
MVMEYREHGASQDQATRTTGGNTELDAATRTGTGSRPRPAPLRARARRCCAEDRRRDERTCRCPPGPVEAPRSGHTLRRAGSLCDRGPGGAEGTAAWRLPPEPPSTSRRGPSASRQWVNGCTSPPAQKPGRRWAWSRQVPPQPRELAHPAGRGGPAGRLPPQRGVALAAAAAPAAAPAA